MFRYSKRRFILLCLCGAAVFFLYTTGPEQLTYPLTLSDAARNEINALKAFEDSSEFSPHSQRQQHHYNFLVFVLTAPNHFEHRHVIRNKSWAGYNWTDSNGVPVNWRYFFVAGQVINNDELKGKLQAEIEEYGDMVLADNEDTYHNLVLKVLWILQYSLGYSYGFLVKTDDDSFLNIKLFDEFLSSLVADNKSELFYGGRIIWQPVLRTGRWNVSVEAMPSSSYPPYCTGGGYILARDTVQTLLATYATGKQPVFYVEDAFIGSLAYASGKVKPQQVPLITWHAYLYCHRQDVILMNFCGLGLLAEYMDNYKRGRHYCNKDFSWIANIIKTYIQGHSSIILRSIFHDCEVPPCP